MIFKKRKEIEQLVTTYGEIYTAVKFGEEKFKNPENPFSVMDECSIKYIGYGRYLIGYFDSINGGKMFVQNRINRYMILFSSAIKIVTYK